MKLVLIEWNDACSFGIAWQDRGDIHDCNYTKCITAGLLIEEDDKQIKVCSSLTPDKFSHTMVIPKSTITRIRRLKIDKT